MSKDVAFINLDHWRGVELAETIKANLEEARRLNLVKTLGASLKVVNNKYQYTLILREGPAIIGRGDSPREALDNFCIEFDRKRIL